VRISLTSYSTLPLMCRSLGATKVPRARIASAFRRLARCPEVGEGVTIPGRRASNEPSVCFAVRSRGMAKVMVNPRSTLGSGISALLARRRDPNPRGGAREAVKAQSLLVHFGRVVSRFEVTG
jgi:hypothetical protein